jgi:hypothetical protein
VEVALVSEGHKEPPPGRFEEAAMMTRRLTAQIGCSFRRQRGVTEGREGCAASLPANRRRTEPANHDEVWERFYSLTKEDSVGIMLQIPSESGRFYNFLLLSQ